MENNRLKNHRTRYSTFAIQLFECAMVSVLFILSFILAGKLIYNYAFPFGWIEGFLLYTMMSAIAIIVLGANKYFSFLSRPFHETATKIIGLVIMMNFIFIALLYFSKSIRLSPYYFIVADTLQILFLFMIKRFTYLLKTNIFKTRVSLVIGKNPDKNQLLRELRGKSLGRLAFASYEDGRLKEYVDKADNVFITGLLSKKLKDRIINYCILKDKKVFIVPETYEIAMRKSEMTQIGDIPLFAIESFRLTEAQNMIKRLMDLLVAILGILLTSPIMLLTAMQIKLEDGGPIFYRQERSGLNGKVFKVIKFRSMIVDAEKNTGAVFAAENDSRITRVGRFMRSTRIDEIPQFFNVLMGSMSMIGPRPERPQFVEEFSRDLPEYSSRLVVKPGITGLAQVMGNYTTCAENKAKFDLVYIRDYSLLLDMKILFKTVKVVFLKSKSKGFAAKDLPDDYDLESELSLDNSNDGQRKKSYQYHKVGKVALVLFCSTIIIFGCMILRYSALTTTMIEAAALSTSSESQLVAENVDIPPTTLDTSLSGSAIMTAAAVGDNKGTTAESSLPTDPPEIAANGQASLTGSHQTERITLKPEPKGEVVLSQEKINDAMGEMSMSEKMGITYQLISRLSAEDLMILDKLSEGGFTAEEKNKAKEMMYQYYNEEEVGYIKEIYWEYVE